jgi:hypothetical protein
MMKHLLSKLEALNANPQYHQEKKTKNSQIAFILT